MDDPPATRTPEFRAMLAAAEAGAIDVMLVGYTARYMRDLALALSYRRWFHRHGVVVYTRDDRILSSNPADWERFVDKCKAAEINSREQSRNVRAGYAAKRDTHGDPGGHPPYGFRRSGDAKVVEIDPEHIDTAVRAYTLSASGLTDREIAGRLGIGIHTIRGLLTSPLYCGRLRDGSVAHWEPVIDDETWRRVQDLRAARNRRSPGRPETRRTYLLPMLEVATGQVTNQTRERHTGDDFLAFLGLLARTYTGRARFMSCSTTSAPTRRPTSRRGSRHMRFTFHFTPTSASWMNQIETWFGILTRQAIRRGSFENTRLLTAAIERFTREWNAGASPFTWVKSADEILAKAVRKTQDDSGARR